MCGRFVNIGLLLMRRSLCFAGLESAGPQRDFDAEQAPSLDLKGSSKLNLRVRLHTTCHMPNGCFSIAVLVWGPQSCAWPCVFLCLRMGSGDFSLSAFPLATLLRSACCCSTLIPISSLFKTGSRYVSFFLSSFFLFTAGKISAKPPRAAFLHVKLWRAC